MIQLGNLRFGETWSVNISPKRLGAHGPIHRGEEGAAEQPNGTTVLRHGG